MSKQYYLVTDGTAEEVERMTGMRATPTPFGVLVEKPRQFNLEAELDKLDRILKPMRPPCICGSHAIIHQPSCPMWGVTI